MPLLHDMMINSAGSLAPTVAGFNTNQNGTTGTTSHAINLPSSVSSGDLLIAILGAEGDRSYTWPSGWVEIADAVNGTISSATIGYRVATGGETTVSVTSSTGTGAAYLSMRITGSWATPIISTTAVGTSTVPDPNSVTSAANRQKLFLPITAGRLNSALAGVAPPSGYTLVGSSSYMDAVGAFATAARLSSSSNTLDPGIFSLSTGSDANWLAWTVIV